MIVNLHKNARTTPAVRQQIQQSTASTRLLARQLGVSQNTVRKWRNRNTTHDKSHRPHNLQTTLTDYQETIVVELRRDFLMPLDLLVYLTQRWINPYASRSGINRCLTRHDLNGLHRLKRLRNPQDKTRKHKPFKAYPPGFIHIDLKYLPTLQHQRQYLCVAIDRASRYVFAQVIADKFASTIVTFLNDLQDNLPCKINIILTDNGREFRNDRFDQFCEQHGIEHRRPPPRHPQTNGMVERFNGRISEITATYHFDSPQDLKDNLLHYVYMYNHAIRQPVLNYITPCAKLEKWQQKRPELFLYPVTNLAERDN